MSKSLVKKVLQKVCRENNIPPASLDRETKFQMFCTVCDNLLEAGSITHSQHKSWTKVF